MPRVLIAKEKHGTRYFAADTVVQIVPRKTTPLSTAKEALRGRQLPLCSIGGGLPHADYGGWGGFLLTCEVRDRFRGVIYFGLTNCNYLLFPTGELVCNFGYHGKAVMARVRKEGWRTFLNEAKRGIQELQAAMGKGAQWGEQRQQVGSS